MTIPGEKQPNNTAPAKHLAGAVNNGNEVC